MLMLLFDKLEMLFLEATISSALACLCVAKSKANEPIRWASLFILP
jgi:hypothetical protein